MGNQQSAETGAELSGHSKAVYACCCSQDGAQILSASGDGTLKLWDVRKLACELRCLQTLVWCDVWY